MVYLTNDPRAGPVLAVFRARSHEAGIVATEVQKYAVRKHEEWHYKFSSAIAIMAL